MNDTRTCYPLSCMITSVSFKRVLTIPREGQANFQTPQDDPQNDTEMTPRWPQNDSNITPSCCLSAASLWCLSACLSGVLLPLCSLSWCLSGVLLPLCSLSACLSAASLVSCCLSAASLQCHSGPPNEGLGKFGEIW